MAFLIKFKVSLKFLHFFTFVSPVKDKHTKQKKKKKQLNETNFSNFAHFTLNTYCERKKTVAYFKAPCLHCVCICCS